MAKYVIGDLQGCYAAFRTLLDTVNFNPSQDHLYLVGDIVARGPDSLACLDYVFKNQGAVTITLGNHDLHLIACALLEKQPNPKDKLEQVFSSSHFDKYIHFLRKQPLAIFLNDENTFISHAGIHPSWNIKKALQYAHIAQQYYQSDEAEFFLEKMYLPHPKDINSQLTPVDQFRAIVNVFTRMRFLDTKGNLNFSEKGSPKSSGLAPWFNHKRFDQDSATYIFGHWAALKGKTNKSNVIGLDTGCVWGGDMTMLELSKNQYFYAKQK